MANELPKVESPFKTYEDWLALFNACQGQFRPDDSFGDVIACSQYETCQECQIRRGCKRRAKWYIPTETFEKILQGTLSEVIVGIHLGFFAKAKNSELKKAIWHLRNKRAAELKLFPDGYAPR